MTIKPNSQPTIVPTKTYLTNQCYTGSTEEAKDPQPHRIDVEDIRRLQRHQVGT